MTAAAHPKFPRKPLQLKLINKAPLKHAHDDEVRTYTSFSLWTSFHDYMGRTAEDFAASTEPNSIHRKDIISLLFLHLYLCP